MKGIVRWSQRSTRAWWPKLQTRDKQKRSKKSQSTFTIDDQLQLVKSGTDITAAIEREIAGRKLCINSMGHNHCLLLCMFGQVHDCVKVPTRLLIEPSHALSVATRELHFLIADVRKHMLQK
eukprot:SAG31_NODE_82_length_27046_cov_45.857275_16_plen_122_part_00